MGLHLDPSEGEPIRVDGAVRAADIRHEWRLARDGIQQIGHGALICPSCAAPVVIAVPLSAAAELRCGFCGHAERSREFLVRDVFDTVANEAYLVARLIA
jgi:hypothetical protein